MLFGNIRQKLSISYDHELYDLLTLYDHLLSTFFL